MVIEPKIRDFICTTAHPLGCQEHVRRQIETVKVRGKMAGPKKVLILGASTGYGLAARIAAAYGAGASTLGVMYERPAAGRRTATAGWYNTAAFERFAAADGLYAKTVNGDAFSEPVKQEVIARIREDLGKVDMVVYSLAAPRRATADGTVYSSVLKTVGAPFSSKSIDLKNRAVVDATIEPASDEEIAATVKVMGGEDWKGWIDALVEADVIEDGAVTLAFSYIGPRLTYPVYYDGTIGMAKKHLYETAKQLTQEYASKNIKAVISVNKALVTQASAAIPIVPLYITILYRVMKQKGLHEGCIEQMDRLLREKLRGGEAVVDEEGMIRLDDYEMRGDVQQSVMQAWESVTTGSIGQWADIDGYWEDFYHMFGFKFENVDYTQDVPID